MNVPQYDIKKLENKLDQLLRSRDDHEDRLDELERWREEHTEWSEKQLKTIMQSFEVAEQGSAKRMKMLEHIQATLDELRKDVAPWKGRQAAWLTTQRIVIRGVTITLWTATKLGVLVSTIIGLIVLYMYLTTGGLP